jgi:glycosyltransferase involved in cell wall biosynthesis
MKISFIIPSRNNLKYLKWCVEAIQKNKGSHDVEICIADDASTDGTWEWCQQYGALLENYHVGEKPPYFKAIRNEGPERLGHTILYDRLINEVATHDAAIIWHADMYLCPGALDAVERLLYPAKVIKPGSRRKLPDGSIEYDELPWPAEKTIVSLTRIEPPLHPPGPEKILLDCGQEPEEFNEEKLLARLGDYKEQFGSSMTTEGIFAPWAFFRRDFQEIGGHDPIFAPQSKEDSDIFNRFHLAGFKFVQTWAGFTYHMTCRGSRFNPTLTTPGTNSSEWERQNIRSARNFIRKWGHYVRHDPQMKPIVPHKYDIQIELANPTYELIHNLEPWCSAMHVRDTGYVPEYAALVVRYVTAEQVNTSYDLSHKFQDQKEHDITVRIDGKRFTPADMQALTYLSDILTDSGEVGSFALGNLEITIKKMATYEHTLIVCAQGVI